MIKFLRIRNLATIEDIQLDFESGFSILTGETGAGKSIIIDSIRLVCGEKGSPDLIRSGKEEASVEAIFLAAGQDSTSGPGAPGSKAAELTVQRTISGEAAGKSYCDGVLVPAKRLKEVSNGLVDIYGQNDHAFLLHLENQLDYLDSSSGTIPLREEVAQSAQSLRRLLRLRGEWRAKELERSQRLDFLDFQIREIEKAGLKPHEEEDLRGERHILKNAEKIMMLVDKALAVSYSADPSISSQLAKLQGALAELAGFDQRFGEMNEALGPLAITLQDAADLLIRYREKQGLSPEALEKIEARLSLIENLKRKYGPQIEDVQVYLNKLKQERKELAGVQDRLQELESDLERVWTDYQSKCQTLSALRQEAAASLGQQIEKEIAQLGMRKARFHIRIAPVSISLDQAEKVREIGIDDVEFMISPNPGEELKPLRKIASGGELSRVMLALKAAGKDRASKTLIFDEIDSGIGGKTAEFIAQKLKSLSRTHQILCITHLPQIASFAAHHFKIEKKVEKDRTYTTVKKLRLEERVEEIARLMSGSRITELSLGNAREMLRHNLKENS